jgi:WD40 repeat protein
VLWDVGTRKRLGEDPLPVKEGSVGSVAFSPDGKTLAAGYGLGTPGGMVLWDVGARRRLAEDPLAVKDTGVTSVVFSADGETLAAGYSRGVALWNVGLESWQRLAGEIANRNFTRGEWRQYFQDEPYRLTFPDLPAPPEATTQAGQR